MTKTFVPPVVAPHAPVERGAHRGARLLLPLLCAALGACAKAPPPGAGGGDAGGEAGSILPVAGTVRISAAMRTVRPQTAMGVNYWSWTYGSTLDGTEEAIAALGPAVLRIGGHNNDWNGPDPFSDAQLDTAIAYARAVGAQPIVQVPLLLDVAGAKPTGETAAAMVRHANVTQKHGVKYFAIGNEPDLYPDPASVPNIPGYTAADYCATVRQYVPAMKAVDPTIQVMGPELSWKYQSGANDWLTAILTDCGQFFDIVSVHRYPIDPARTTTAAAAADAALFSGMIASVRQKMAAAGAGDKPLALTETNFTWNGDPATSTLEASPGTLPAGLWMADVLGVAFDKGLWTTAVWSIREGWTLGLLTPASVKRPAYHALSLFAQHFGPSVIKVTAAPAGVHAYASRNQADTATQVIAINWGAAPATLTFVITELATLATPPAPATFTFASLSMSAIEIPDSGAASAVTYGPAQVQAAIGPQAP